jgi:FixJ family two-component response regulator
VSSGQSQVYVVDDDPSMQEALKSLLRSEGLDVTVYSSATDFLAAAPADVPSCVILDVQMPGLSGLDLQRELGSSDRPLPIVFITGHGDIPMSVRAMKAGAVEFLPKPFRDDELIAAVKAALASDRTNRERRHELRSLRSRYEQLTPRERDVLLHVVQGLLNKQVAAALGITEITVKVHRRQAMQKMGAGSLAELVQMATQLGLTAGDRRSGDR